MALNGLVYMITVSENDPGGMCVWYTFAWVSCSLTQLLCLLGWAAGLDTLSKS